MHTFCVFLSTPTVLSLCLFVLTVDDKSFLQQEIWVVMEVKSLANQKTGCFILKSLISLIFTGVKARESFKFYLEIVSTLIFVSSTNFMFGVGLENTAILHEL